MQELCPTNVGDAIFGKQIQFSEPNGCASLEMEQLNKQIGHDHAIEDSSCQAPRIQTAKLPDEMLLCIFDYLESEVLLSFAEAWPRIAEVIAKYNVIRTRELQCFHLLLSC